MSTFFKTSRMKRFSLIGLLPQSLGLEESTTAEQFLLECLLEVEEGKGLKWHVEREKTGVRQQLRCKETS